jgi:hypothetical protein
VTVSLRECVAAICLNKAHSGLNRAVKPARKRTQSRAEAWSSQPPASSTCPLRVGALI